MRKLLLIFLWLLISTINIALAETIEIIIFENLSTKNSNEIKELMPKYIGEINATGNKELFNTSVPVKFLINEYNKIQKNQKYKIILQGMTDYNLLPSQKNKKFLVKSTNSDFTGILIITPIISIRNTNFNVIFDGIFANNRLTKSVKIKSKEIYYFDHPSFGALFTIY